MSTDEPAPTDTQRGIPAGAMLNKEENEMLEWLVETYGSDRAKVIRKLIKDKYEELQNMRRSTDKFKKAIKGQHQNHRQQQRPAAR